MSNFIVTFGQAHIHKVNGKIFDKDCVALIKAESYDAMRRLAHDLFDNVFCTTYTEAEYDQGGMSNYYPRGKIEV